MSDGDIFVSLFQSSDILTEIIFFRSDILLTILETLLKFTNPIISVTINDKISFYSNDENQGSNRQSFVMMETNNLDVKIKGKIVGERLPINFGKSVRLEIELLEKQRGGVSLIVA